MLRIFRAKTSELDSRVIKFIPLYDAFYKAMKKMIIEAIQMTSMQTQKDSLNFLIVILLAVIIPMKSMIISYTYLIE